MAPDRYAFGGRRRHGRYCNCESCTAAKLGQEDPKALRAQAEELTPGSAVDAAMEILGLSGRDADDPEKDKGQG